ncbi:hypothetical protein N2152v2_000667 [Parachlorella kessleri]
MAQLLHSAFAGLCLKSSTPRRQQPFVSNGTVQRLAMKSKKTYQVETPFHLTGILEQVVVGNEEATDIAMKRFRREVMAAGVIPEVRRRRYFENTAEAKKRKFKESRMKAKRFQGVKPYGQTVGLEPAPFSDLFGTADDIFAEVLAEDTR